MHIYCMYVLQLLIKKMLSKIFAPIDNIIQIKIFKKKFFFLKSSYKKTNIYMYLLEQCRGVISDGIDFENHDPSNVGMRFEIFLPSPDTHCFQSVVGVRWQQPLSVGDTIGSTRITGTEKIVLFF